MRAFLCQTALPAVLAEELTSQLLHACLLFNLLQIAVQIALVIAKAARFDFPQQWPSLFTDMLAGLANSSAGAGQQPQQQPSQQQQALLVRRTYFVLHHVLKELASKRLAADQKAFAQVKAAANDRRAGVQVSGARTASVLKDQAMCCCPGQHQLRAMDAAFPHVGD